MVKGRNTGVIGVRVSDEVKEFFQGIADRKKVTISEVVKEILEWYKKKMEEK